MDTLLSHNDVNYRVAERELKYYIFDWDDNILHMPTHIHLLKKNENGEWLPHSVSTSVFALIRNDTENYGPPGGDWENAFVEFRDLDPRTESNFLRDTRKALAPVISGDGKVPPSFLQFKETLIEGRLFAIVTARGHSSDSIRKGVEYFIDAVLTEKDKAEMTRNLRGYLHVFEGGSEGLSDNDVVCRYLDLNRYHAVTSPEFKKKVCPDLSASENPEQAKQLAIKDFVEHIVDVVEEVGIGGTISIGFSDDDPGNVAAVQDYISRELANEFPGVRFVVYDTSDPAVPSGRKVIVRGQLKLEGL